MLSPLKLNTFGPLAQSNYLSQANIYPQPPQFQQVAMPEPIKSQTIQSLPQPQLLSSHLPTANIQQQYQAPNFAMPQPQPIQQMQPLSQKQATYTSALRSAETTPTVAGDLGSKIIKEAMKYTSPKNPLHNAYNQKGTIPGGWDCSSFVQRVVKSVTGKNVTRSTYSQIPFWKKQGMFVAGKSLRGIQAGDPVYFATKNGQHTGIYIGNGKMVDNAGRGKPIKIRNVWRSGILGYGALNRWLS